MNYIDYFNQQVESYFKELMLHHRKVYERNRTFLEKQGDQDYLRKFEDDFEESRNCSKAILRSSLQILPSKLEDQKFSNQRECQKFCNDVIHKEVKPYLAYGIELEEANLRATANQYIRIIKEKEGKE